MKIVKLIKGGDIMIWYDMSYNKIESEILNNLEIEQEEKEEEDIANEFNKTNTPVFNSY